MIFITSILIELVEFVCEALAKMERWLVNFTPTIVNNALPNKQETHAFILVSQRFT